MAYIELPTRNDLPTYEYLILLDGTNYTLTYTFNQRMGKWLINLADSLGNDIVSQVPITSSWPILYRFNETAIPPGVIFAFDTSGTDTDPGRYDLGERVRMFYATKGTL